MRALLIVIILVGVAAFAVMRARRARLAQQRRAAWQAKRAEQDRIWYERIGEDPPTH